MGGRKVLSIDSDALRKELKKRNLTGTEVSLGVGYRDKTSFSKILRSGRISPVICKALQREYNIDPESYLVPEKTSEQEETNVTVIPTIEIEKFADIKDELYRVIYGAVYAAVKKALSE